jgi:uncharacterized membrane protein YfcA
VILYAYPLKKGVGTALILSIVVSTATFMTYQVFGFLFNGTFYFDLSISLFLAIGSITSGLIASSYIQKISATTMGRGIGIIISVLGILSLIVYFSS